MKIDEFRAKAQIVKDAVSAANDAIEDAQRHGMIIDLNISYVSTLGFLDEFKEIAVETSIDVFKVDPC